MTAPASAQPKARILVVDDTPANLRLLLDMLSEHGYATHPAASGAAALRFVGTTLPDLILLDVMMPGMDGFEVCTQLKANERTRDIPVLFISAADQLLDKVKAFKVGGADYIVKPFQPEEVIARIETHLSLYLLQRHLEERVQSRTTELMEANFKLRAEEEELRREEERFRFVSLATRDAIYDWDARSGKVLRNEAYQELFSPHEPVGIGMTWWEDHIHPDDRDRVVESIETAFKEKRLFWSDEYRFLRADNSYAAIIDRGYILYDDAGAPARMIGAMADMTERKRSEERLNYLAHHDLLTGLPNRVLLHDRLRHATVDAGRHGRLVGVAFLDLDRFKTINDTLGHAAGDQLLKEVAKRLSQCVRKGDTVARLSGDEFALVLADMAQLDDAARLAQKILDVFTLPFQIDGQDLFVTASLGMTLYPHDDSDTDVLLRNADVAMYRSKDAGRNAYHFYTAEMTTKATENLALENELHQAIERGELLLYYQPIVEAESEALIGVEALARWRHPQRGMIAPDRFIPLAEETGLIVSLGEWVLREACAQCRRWQRAGYTDLHVAVNLSARQFQQPNFARRVRTLVEESGLNPESLELEITESLLLKHHAETLETLWALFDMGATLAIDDFGTGYSSLSYLKRFPVKLLKIDQSFTHDISTDADAAAISQAIISMAHALGIKTVAEGVETREQRDFLRTHGCDALQGNFFSKALPAAELAPMMQANHYPRVAR